MNDFSEISLRSLLENAHIGIIIHRWDTTIVYANPAALRLLRVSYEQLLGKDALDPGWYFIDESNRRLQPEEYPVNKVHRFRSALRNEVIGVVDSHSPEVSWFQVNAYPEGDADSGEGFIVVIFAEITSERTRFSFRDIVEHADDMIVVTDAGDIDPPSGPRIVYVNRAFERQTGYGSDELLGETPRMLQGGLTDAAARARIRERLQNQEPVREKLLNYCKSGVPYWVEMNVVPLRNRFGEVTHFAAIQRNVSEQTFYAEQLERRNADLRALKENLNALVDQRTRELRDANLQLERLAFYDPLTQIPNRRCFMDQAMQQCARARRRGLRVAVGILDIDHFKKVNDAHGHPTGDRLLVALAGCLTRFFRQEDVYGRLGGEEFGFCMVLPPDSDPLAIAERLRLAVADLRLELDECRVLQPSVSIGVVLGGPEPPALDQLIAAADAALYRAKEEGRNTCRLGADTNP